MSTDGYGYLTPDNFTPTDYICGRLRIPNDQRFVAAFMGALIDLAFENSWRADGTMTPFDASQLALSVYDDFVASRGSCMIGTILPFATVNPPKDCLICDGTIYERQEFPDLYDALLPVYQVTANTFQVPDLRGQVLIGADFTIDSTVFNPGDTLGEFSHTLTVGEMPAHAHDTSPHTHSEVTAIPTIINGGLEAPASSATPGAGVTGAAGVTVLSSGSGAAHNNVQPSTALRYCIVAK